MLFYVSQELVILDYFQSWFSWTDYLPPLKSLIKHEEVVLEQQQGEKHLQYLSSARWFYPLRTHRASPSCYPVWFCGVTSWDNQGVHFREILCQYSDTNFDISNTYINISYYNGNYFWIFYLWDIQNFSMFWWEICNLSMLYINIYDIYLYKVSQDSKL